MYKRKFKPRPSSFWWMMIRQVQGWPWPTCYSQFLNSFALLRDCLRPTDWICGQKRPESPFKCREDDEWRRWTVLFTYLLRRRIWAMVWQKHQWKTHPCFPAAAYYVLRRFGSSWQSLTPRASRISCRDVSLELIESYIHKRLLSGWVRERTVEWSSKVEASLRHTRQDLEWH